MKLVLGGHSCPPLSIFIYDKSKSKSKAADRSDRPIRTFNRLTMVYVFVYTLANVVAARATSHFQPGKYYR
jgi:hypothetical protein